MDEQAISTLQTFRMITLWPLIVAVTAFFLMRLVLIFVNDRRWLSKTDVSAAVVIGAMAGLVAVVISLMWSNHSSAWWTFFTAGLIVLAVVLLVTAIQLAMSDLHHVT